MINCNKSAILSNNSVIRIFFAIYKLVREQVITNMKIFFVQSQSRTQEDVNAKRKLP